MVDGTAIKVEAGGTLFEATTNISSSVNKAAVHICAKFEAWESCEHYCGQISRKW